jgi:hypothetical protein
VIRTAGPVAANVQRKSADLTLIIDRIGLNEVVRLISDNKASADGTISGRLPIRVTWPLVHLGSGRIANDAPGMLNFGEQVGDMASSIAERDPRLQGQRDQIMAALQNFHYDEIVFEFQMTERGLEVASRLAGRGMKGTKTPLDVTIRHVGLEDAINAYLVAKFGVKTTAE